MNCKNCGAPVEAGQTFCSSCGANIAAEPQPQANGGQQSYYVPPAGNQPPYGQQPYYPQSNQPPYGQQPYGAPPVYGPPAGNQPPPEIVAASQKKVRGGLILAIVGIVIGIIGFFVGYVFFLTLFAGVGAIVTAVREKKNGANTTACFVLGIVCTVFGAILTILLIVSYM